MGDDAERYAHAFGTLNWLADQALNEDGSAFTPQQVLKFAPRAEERELPSEGKRLDLLDWDNAGEVVFRTRDAAQYFRGGWLEEFVWLKLHGIKPRDWEVNVRTRSVAQDVENDFDALLVHRNRLLVIECKTSGFGRNEVKDVSHVYKLAQLADKVGGSMSRKLLLSARPIHADIRQRASEHGVDILAAEEVKKLVDYLRTWMNR